MVRWYCVKANKQTECVQRSGYKTAKKLQETNHKKI